MTGRAAHNDSRPVAAPSSRRAGLLKARAYSEEEWKKSRGLVEYARQNEVVEPGDAINNNRVVVIEGVAGSGKSTMLKALTRRHAADQAKPLPLYVPLKLLDLSMTNAPTPIEALMRLLAWPLDSQEYVAAAIRKAEKPNSRGVRFLFDGLDEVQRHRPQIINLIRQLSSSHYVVVATRHEGSEPLPNYKDFTVLPLLRTDSEKFATRWLEIIAEAKGIHESERSAWVDQRSHWLRDQLDDRPYLRDVALNRTCSRGGLIWRDGSRHRCYRDSGAAPTSPRRARKPCSTWLISAWSVVCRWTRTTSWAVVCRDYSPDEPGQLSDWTWRCWTTMPTSGRTSALSLTRADRAGRPATDDHATPNRSRTTRSRT